MLTGKMANSRRLATEMKWRSYKMEKTTLNVNGMSCEHCVKAITQAVTALDGVSDVNVNLGAKTVTITHDLAKSPLDKIKVEIEEQGYEVVV
ncbi:MAG: copper ion binding protein [Syntrophomonadaceae bacterium]|jgi:copper chaperone|nr:copper ion binding protein [Syntrophomonadaceae bacterium]